jgi:hypothetical protein
MPVNQNIQQFYNNAASRDFSRDFLFRVTQLKLPGAPALSDNELVYVKGANLPKRSINNVKVPYMGVDFNIPGGVKYEGENYQLEFFLDSQSILRNFFESASRTMFDDASSTGAYGTPGYDSYIILAQLDKNLEPISYYKLVGASIRDINAIQYKISDGTGSTVDMTITFAYHYYEVL